MIRKTQKACIVMFGLNLFVLTFLTMLSMHVMAAPTVPDVATKQDVSTLQEKIAAFNKQFCPPEKEIDEINEFNLARLEKAELIKPADLDKYREMVMDNGKVLLKSEKLIGKPGKNLIGSFDTACEELKDRKNRGATKGNQKPERLLKLKVRRIVYRDQENQLKEMEMYSPPRFPAKKKKIAGKKGKLIKDYATTIMVPKDGTENASKTAVFEDMPSADSWLDDGEGQIKK